MSVSHTFITHPPPLPIRWMDRKVLDAARHPSGWVMITSCPRLGEGGAAASYAQAMDGCRVTLYHPASQRSLQLAATCGAFLPAEDREEEGEEEGGEGVSDPLVGVYVCRHTGDQQEGQLLVLDLRQAPSSKLLTTVSALAAESSPLVAWSLTLRPQHVHTEERNHSPFTVPGFLLEAYTLRQEQEQEQQPQCQRICVLTNSGDLYLICPAQKKLLRSVSVSNESIVASTLVGGGGGGMHSPPLLYLLAGSTGALSAVSPALFE
jgi:hypothetical protein